MLIVCYACEGIYQGLHGIEDYTILEVKNMADALVKLDEWGNEASNDLIYSYGLEDEYMEELDNDFNADISDSFYYENREWYGYVIEEGYFSSIDDAKTALYDMGYDDFVKYYTKVMVE